MSELRGREDELILEAKRLRERLATEARERQQLEEANRELSFQIEELRDEVDGQQSSNKARGDELLHWRKVGEELRLRNRTLEMENSKLRDANEVLEREQSVLLKDVANKEAHLHEMRQKINALIAENGVAKDEVFLIATKLYQLEQQNLTLRAEHRRLTEEQLPLAYVQQQIREADSRIHSDRLNPVTEKQTNEAEHKTERRRGEFARERGLKKAEIGSNSNKKGGFPQSAQKEAAEKQTEAEGDGIGPTMRRLKELNEEL
jgi:hypothetical protein